MQYVHLILIVNIILRNDVVVKDIAQNDVSSNIYE